MGAPRITASGKNGDKHPQTDADRRRIHGPLHRGWLARLLDKVLRR